ncbi:MAG: hypothetical protein CSB01_01440 [Bacteroidia bacterium]|nr:MAG: hypothetical protein CSB01_01440 [Bacteroidia bacterium]
MSKTIQERLKQAQEIYANAKAKGFHNEDLSIKHCLMLVFKEVGGAVNAHRKGDDVNNPFLDSTYKEVYLRHYQNGEDSIDMEPYKCMIKGTWQDEIADVYIRLMDLVMMIEDKHNFSLEAVFERNEEEHLLSFATSLLWQDELTKPFVEKCFTLQVLINDIFRNYELKLEREFLAWNLACVAMNLEKFFDFDLGWHVAEKMKYNATRRYLHGKAY